MSKLSPIREFKRTELGDTFNGTVDEVKDNTSDNGVDWQQILVTQEDGYQRKLLASNTIKAVLFSLNRDELKPGEPVKLVCVAYREADNGKSYPEFVIIPTK